MKSILFALGVVCVVAVIGSEANVRLFRRNAEHTTSMHNHLSRKVLERACAAGKDAIDDIVACFSKNEAAKSILKPEIAMKCHKEAFNMDFEPNNLEKHHKLICEHRDKFELMAACVYREVAMNADSKARDALTEALVDMGLCIINALD